MKDHEKCGCSPCRFDYESQFQIGTRIIMRRIDDLPEERGAIISWTNDHVCVVQLDECYYSPPDDGVRDCPLEVCEIEKES